MCYQPRKKNPLRILIKIHVYIQLNIINTYIMEIFFFVEQKKVSPRIMCVAEKETFFPGLFACMLVTLVTFVCVTRNQIFFISVEYSQLRQEEEQGSSKGISYHRSHILFLKEKGRKVVLNFAPKNKVPLCRKKGKE